MNNKFRTKSKMLFGATLTAAMLLSGCGDGRDEFVLTNTNNNPQVFIPPLAVNDAFNALGNATVNQAASGVLANDTVNGATISSFDAVGSQGGAIALNADGSFTYTPALNFKGAETFNYTLLNGFGTSTATVTMTSTGLGRFVDNSGANGTGTQASPFNNLADAVAAAQSGDTIFVSRGNGTNTGLSDDVILPQGVNLIGEGLGLILAQTIVPQGQAPVLNATVTVSGDNTISGFTFEGVDDAINGDGFTNVTITNNTFTNGFSDELQLDLGNVSGTITISNNTFSLNSDIDATDIDTAATGTCTFVLNNNTFQLTTPTADGDDCFQIEVDGDTVATIQMNDNMFNGSATGSSSLERGLDLNTFNTSQTTVTASGNMAQFMDESWFEVNTANSSVLTATFTGNVLDQNLDSTDSEIKIETNQDSQATIVFDNNNITGSADNGIEIDMFGSSALNLALRNNTITGTGNEAANIEADSSSNFCGEITGNTFGADLVFDEDTAGNYNVEQFGNPAGDVLETLNTFTSGGVVVTQGLVNSVADGFCAIP